MLPNTASLFNPLSAIPKNGHSKKLHEHTPMLKYSQ